VTESDRQRWDAKYALRDAPTEIVADDWLVECATPLPAGRALDLACGLGHNAIWLAEHGWTVDAVDISPVGLELADKRAKQAHVSGIRWIEADLDTFQPESAAHDLVLVFRFLDRRSIASVVQAALKPGGRLVYETFTTAQLERDDDHIQNQNYVLYPGELPEMFPGSETVVYREETLGDRTVARLLASQGEPDA